MLGMALIFIEEDRITKGVLKDEEVNGYIVLQRDKLLFKEH